MTNQRQSREGDKIIEPLQLPIADKKAEEENARLAFMEALEKFAEPGGVGDNPEATTPYAAIPPLPPFLSLEMVERQASVQQSPRAAESPSQGSKKFTAKALGRENYHRSQTATKRSSRQKEKASILRKWFSSLAAIFETVIYFFFHILLWPADRFMSLDGKSTGWLLFIALVGVLVLKILSGPVEPPTYSRSRQAATPVATTNSIPRNKVNMNGNSKNKKTRKQKQPSARRDPEF